MNNNEQLIERLKVMRPVVFKDWDQETIDLAIAALSQGAERIEFERNLTFKYEKLSAELQSRIDELEAGISDEIEALQETITNSIKREDILQAKIKEYDKLINDIHEVTNSRVIKIMINQRIAAMKGEDDE